MRISFLKTRIILSVLTWLAAYVFVFHEMLLSGFSSIPGDMLDTRFTLHLQEHWYHILSAKASWLDLKIFYPEENTLGLSDAFFLFGLSHAFFRFCGLDIFNSYIANLTFISFVGFFGMLIFLRRSLKLSWWVSCGSSFLFIISQIIHGPALSSHTQFLTIWYCPWFLYFFFRFCNTLFNPTNLGVIWAIFAGSSLAFLFYNAFYFTWFMVFYIGMTLPIFLILLRFKRHHNEIEKSQTKEISLHSLLKELGSFFRQNTLQLTVFTLSFGTCLTPFLLTYIDVFHRYGSWDYPTVQKLLPHFSDFFHVSPNNLAWGWTIERLCGPNNFQSELSYGFPFGTLMLLFLSSAFLLIKKNWGCQRLLAITMIIGIGVSWVLLLQINDTSLWKSVFEIIPGAGAIRAPFRYNAFLILPTILIIAISTNEYIRFRKNGKLRSIEITAILLLVTIVTAEQWSIQENHPWRLNHNEIRETLRNLPAPPADMECFFIEQQNSNEWRSNYLAEFNAFAVAQAIGVPTINGYSGKFPPQYNLRDSLRHSTPDAYQKSILIWLFQHDITKGVYGLDYENGHWQKFDNLFQTYARNRKINTRYNFGENIEFGLNGISTNEFSAKECIFSGFSSIEDDFTWTIEENSKLIFLLENAITSETTLKIYAHALVGKNHPQQDFIFSVNGEKVAELKYSNENNEGWKEFKIPTPPLPRNALLFSIKSKNPAKPSDLERSNDSRLLGLAIHKIVLQ